jgi:hypothetical protein
MRRTSVDYTFIDPKYGNARCMNCKAIRTFTRGEGARARNTDPDTSHMAAVSVHHIRESQQLILKVLEAHGPGTDEDIYEWLLQDVRNKKFSLSGSRTRRSELVRLGFVVDSGEKKTLPSRRLSIIWRKK